MLRRRIAARLPAVVAALMLWLMIANIMGTSASCSDSKQASSSFSAFTSSRWVQTTRSDFLLDARSSVDVDRFPGDVVLSGRTEYLYAFRGSNTRTFWGYNISSGTWASLANAPGTLKDEGGALASDGDRYVYAIQGGNRQFWRYDTLTNSWTNLARTPSSVRLGGGLCYDGAGRLYTLQGGSSTGFWMYSVSTNAWTVLASTPGQVGDGGCLVHDQGGYVYALQGGGSGSFWRYTVSSNQWTSMVSSPYQVRYGGAMAFDGVVGIYMFPGSYQDYFLRYNISQSRWDALADIPATVGLGGSLAFSYPSKVNAFSGFSTRSFWRYDVSTNIWSSAASAPGSVGAGGALAAGPMVNSRSGTLTSVVLDTNVSGAMVQGLYWNETLRPGTDIVFEMRASNSLVAGAPDAPWVSLGGTSPVMSGLPSGRYLQWRATLSTTNIHLTPELQEVRVYHT